MKNAIKLVLALALIPALYVGGSILYGTFTDFQPEEKISLSVQDPVQLKARDSVYTFMIWNIGYSGLGEKSDFFMDGGTKVRSTEEEVNAYLAGIRNVIKGNSFTDFIMLQEVDTNSARSYTINQLKAISLDLPKHNYTFASNFHVERVPVPIHTPWDVIGKVRSGLATYSRYQPDEVTRYQFPGKYPYPKRVFHLDRCFLVKRFTLPWGKDLLVINTHNSAYDEGGTLKKQEMDYMKNYLLQEYEKGNYVVVGGDWNQIPPGFDNNTFAKIPNDTYEQTVIPENYPAEGWQYAWHPKIPTNRKLATPYNKDSTFTTIIDFYLVSPNVEVEYVRAGNLDFKYSDHQPVYMEVKLK